MTAVLNRQAAAADNLLHGVDNVGRAAEQLEDALFSVRMPEMSVPEIPVPETPEPVEIPVTWQTDDLDVFTGTGAERYAQEVNSVNSMMERLSALQNEISQNASSGNILPPNAASDLTAMNDRIQAIQARIQQISANPINMVSPSASNELEGLRAELSSALQQQEALNEAVQNMDVSAANEAYLRLSQTIGGMEREIRDNVDEQGQFNSSVREGTTEANNLKDTFAGIGAAVAAAFSVSKIKDFVNSVFELNNTQMTVEVQLATVLNNQGEGIDAFDQIREKASEIQGKTMYGDEAMIAGAAELSTYISDPEAISSMMDTLSNYAAGMSGGGAVDTSAMTEYATQLGKALDGTYDGLTKKGFALSEEQQKIIENGTDMEKALVLDEVIGQSWADLAENMRQTPTGIITSIQNSIGDMGEVIGARLTPAFMELANAVYDFLTSSGVEQVIDTIIVALTYVFDILEWGIGVLQTAADNWDMVGGVLLTVASALAFYKVAAMGAKIAQDLLNGSMLANPATWVIVVFAAAAGAIALYTSSVNDAYGLTLSFSGMIGGSLMTILAALGNLVIMIYNIVIESILEVWNIIAEFVNFFANVWNDPLGSVVRLFTGVFDAILAIVETVAGAIGSLFGLDWSSGIQNFRDEMNAAVEQQYGTGAIDVTVDEKMLSLDYIDYGEAFDAGYYLADNLFGGDSSATDTDPYTFDYDSLFNSPTGTEDDPIHTEVDNDINIADEDLQLMRDVAEARYVQNFVTLTPTVQVSGNTINEKVDVNSVVDEIEVRLTNEIAASAEGVYG